MAYMLTDQKYLPRMNDVDDRMVRVCQCSWWNIQSGNMNNKSLVGSHGHSLTLSIYLPIMSNPCWGPRHMRVKFKVL